MSAASRVFTGGPVFDGRALHCGKAARFVDGHFAGLISPADITVRDHVVDLSGDILSPGFVDLQVNGGGGVMLNDASSSQSVATIASAHRSLGTVALLPTLITDTRARTEAAIRTVAEAVQRRVAGVIGLHLEGPHLSAARKGAHDESLIRPMEQEDLALLLAAAQRLPLLKITIAPEAVTLRQVRTLRAAGVLIALGHTDADFDTCIAYAQAGATCVTHLFNAMSQLGNRAPGLVGATLCRGSLSAGLIADGAHVHPATMQAAWAAKTGPGQIYLVSDAMAVAGTDMLSFALNGREIRRQNGQLRLADDTLAGADLELVTAVARLIQQCAVAPERALAAATTVPAALAGLENHHMRAPGLPETDAIRISSDYRTAAVAN